MPPEPIGERVCGAGCCCAAPGGGGVNVVHFLRSFTSLSRQPCLQLLLLVFAGLVMYRAGAAARALDGYGVIRASAFMYEPVGGPAPAAGAAPACDVVAFRLTKDG
jgi:hypothetical protein